MMMGRSYGLHTYSSRRFNTGLLHRYSGYEYMVEFDQPSLAFFSTIAGPRVVLASYKHTYELPQTHR
jgi:hypothetical protein